MEDKVKKLVEDLQKISGKEISLEAKSIDPNKEYDIAKFVNLTGSRIKSCEFSGEFEEPGEMEAIEKDYQKIIKALEKYGKIQKTDKIPYSIILQVADKVYGIGEGQYAIQDILNTKINEEEVDEEHGSETEWAREMQARDQEVAEKSNTPIDVVQAVMMNDIDPNDEQQVMFVKFLLANNAAELRAYGAFLSLTPEEMEQTIQHYTSEFSGVMQEIVSLKEKPRYTDDVNAERKSKKIMAQNKPLILKLLKEMLVAAESAILASQIANKQIDKSSVKYSQAMISQFASANTFTELKDAYEEHISGSFDEWLSDNL